MACRPSVDHVISSMDGAIIFQMREMKQKEKHIYSPQSGKQRILLSDPGFPIPWCVKQSIALPSRVWLINNNVAITATEGPGSAS